MLSNLKTRFERNLIYVSPGSRVWQAPGSRGRKGGIDFSRWAQTSGLWLHLGGFYYLSTAY